MTEFSILSTNAPLVEVSGNGPIADLANGLTVPDGTAITAPVSLLNAPIRRWRVDAATNVQTAVVVTDSPFGAFVSVRRCVAPSLPPKWWRYLQPIRWPRLALALQRHASSALALWHLFATDVQPCSWQDIGDGITNQAQARGGDLIVVAFVTP